MAHRCHVRRFFIVQVKLVENLFGQDPPKSLLKNLFAALICESLQN